MIDHSPRSALEAHGYTVDGGGGNRTRETFPPLGRIYVLQAEHGGPAKIGWVAAADNLDARVKILQTGNPHPLRVVTTEPGTRADERALHREFRYCQLQGEWFEPDKEFVARFPDVKIVIKFERFRHYFVEGWDEGYERGLDDENAHDPAGWAVLEAYATACESYEPELAAHLRQHVRDERVMQGLYDASWER